ncbi:hypothetical protein Q1695_001987 [Nippostrongylus brasiliensis]|nr:hypothetical protein Q1695_001987 [Nippostrongylus brasiliensis]
MHLVESIVASCLIIFTVCVRTSSSAPGCNRFCKIGYKCVMVVPDDCIGCEAFTKCVQQQCDTQCNMFCPFNNTCVLKETSCCPVPACRPNGPIQVADPNAEE